MYVYIYAYVYMYMRARARARTHTHTHTHTCMYVCMCNMHYCEKTSIFPIISLTKSSCYIKKILKKNYFRIHIYMIFFISMLLSLYLYLSGVLQNLVIYFENILYILNTYLYLFIFTDRKHFHTRVHT